MLKGCLLNGINQAIGQVTGWDLAGAGRVGRTNKIVLNKREETERLASKRTRISTVTTHCKTIIKHVPTLVHLL